MCGRFDRCLNARGLTGSEGTAISYATGLAARGHEVVAFAGAATDEDRAGLAALGAHLQTGSGWLGLADFQRRRRSQRRGLVGAGLHTTQTVGLALATDLAPVDSQPRVVALMCSMLLVGMALSAVIFGLLLRDFSQLRLIQVIQGSAAVTMILNIIALWKQEARDPSRTAHALPTPSFRESWESFSHRSHAKRRLVALGLGTVAFSMQDILLEPFGGEVLKLPVASRHNASTTLSLKNETMLPLNCLSLVMQVAVDGA